MIGASTIVPLLLAIVGGVVYHIAAKSIPREAAPTLVLVVVYATALSLSALSHLWLATDAERTSWSRLLHPGIIGVGVGAAMIELGYVLVYRAALPVSVASALVNVMVAALLVPVGLLAFGERMSPRTIAGMLLCLAGVWLLRH